MKYPNYGCRPVGYTIIDTDAIGKIRSSTSEHRTPWSVNHNTEEASLRQIKFRDIQKNL